MGPGQLLVCDAATGRPVGPSLPHPAAVRRAALTADGARLLTAAWDGTVRAWDAATGEPVGAAVRLGSPLTQVAFSPDGSRVVTGGEDRLARVWSTSTFEPAGPPVKHQGAVGEVVFSPDGRRVLTVAAAGPSVTAGAELRVWDAATGEPILPPRSVSWDPGGMDLASLAAAGTSDKAPTGRADGAKDGGKAAPAGPMPSFLEQLRGPAPHAEFSADGRRVLLAAGSSAWVSDLEPNPLPAEDLVRLAGVLTGARVDRTGALVPFDAEDAIRAWRELPVKYPGRFTTPPDQARAWHHREAERAVERMDYDAAAFHLRRVPDDAADPALGVLRGDTHLWKGEMQEALADYSRVLARGSAGPAVHYRRAMALFLLGRYREAADDLAAILEAHPDHLGLRQALAVLRLATGDADGYRSACRGLVDRLDRVRDAGAAEGVVWTCVLGPGAPDLGPLRERAEELAAGEKNYSRLNTLGAVLYRAGDYEGAVRRLEEAARAQGKDGTAWDMLFLAMAHQRLGHGPEAKQWLGRAVRWTEQTTAGTGKGGPPTAGLTPGEELELRVLRREAEALVAGK
jgi:tetratricopeptide (TPR) repeat protein